MIIFCVLASLISVIPYFVDYKELTEPLDLWVPHDSDQYKNGKWLEENYPSTIRPIAVLMTSSEDTILTTKNIQSLLDIRNQINILASSTNGVTWHDVCLKLLNPWSREPQCLENSLLEIWAKNGSYIETNQTIWAKSDDDILYDVNNIQTSGIFNIPINLDLYLGGIGYISEEKSIITHAKALHMTMHAHLEQRNFEESRKRAREFEQEVFINLMNEFSSSNEGSPLQVHYFCLKNMKDSADKAIDEDLSLLSMGFIIVFVYVMATLGKLNFVEQRVYLSLLGILAIALGTAASYGVCQLLGIPSTKMNSILPFMLLGIGIDDMFVIVQGLMNVHNDESRFRYI